VVAGGVRAEWGGAGQGTGPLSMVAEAIYEPAYTEEPLDEFRWIDRDHAERRWRVIERARYWTFERLEWRGVETKEEKS
jgi:hypothetical protein